MQDTTDTCEPELDDSLLLELANELHRLASGLRRDLRRNAVLPGLSDLTAMQQLHAMLTEALSARINRPDPDSQGDLQHVDTSHQMAGYL